MAIPKWLHKYLKLASNRLDDFRLGSADVRKKVVADVTLLIEKLSLEKRKVGLTKANKSASRITV